MNGDRLYNLGLTMLRIFHWGMFVSVVEIMFWYAGGALFGLLQSLGSGAFFQMSPPAPGRALMLAFQVAGNYAGLAAGLLFTRFVMGRYFASDEV